MLEIMIVVSTYIKTACHGCRTFQDRNRIDATTTTGLLCTTI